MSVSHLQKSATDEKNATFNGQNYNECVVKANIEQSSRLALKFSWWENAISDMLIDYFKIKFKMFQKLHLAKPEAASRGFMKSFITAIFLFRVD